ncbi:MAG: NAD(P)/FAD-dependent oxidoreductase [Thermoplasmata archaeon]|nr:MAG: NAD(P)/FAD-dependent oxidoreductase [Thermoplasmata archaeon]
MGSKKIGVIGAGIAGLTAGLLLTKKGFNVEIFEKEKIIGGRALTINLSTLSISDYRKLLSDFKMFIPFSNPDLEDIFSKKLFDGYKFDLGYHAIGGGDMSNINLILKKFNEHVDFLESYVGFIREDGYDYPFLSKLDKLKILPNIMRLLLVREKTLQKMDSIPITETIERYGHGKMKLILEVFSRSITTVNDLSRISTGEMIRAQRNLYRGSKPVGYPINGLIAIHDKIADLIGKQGGKIHLDSTVENIVIEDNKVKGITVNGVFHPYDIVVFTLPPQNLSSFASENIFPDEYVKTLKSLTATGSLCAYYALDKMDSNLVGKTFHFIERDIGVEGNDAVGMIDFMTASPKSKLSPRDYYLIQSYIICTPEEAKDKKILEKLKTLLDENLARLLPDYENHLKWAIYPAIWHLDGVAKTIDNIKPSISTPIENLYLIGDGVKATGIGFNCAVNSAKLLYNSLIQ